LKKEKPTPTLHDDLIRIIAWRLVGIDFLATPQSKSMEDDV